MDGGLQSYGYGARYLGILLAWSCLRSYEVYWINHTNIKKKYPYQALKWTENPLFEFGSMLSGTLIDATICMSTRS